MSTQKPTSSLQKQIVTTFVILAVVALGSITVTTGIFVGVIGNTASNQTTDALESQVQQDMLGKINRSASIIDSNYDHVKADLDGLAQATNDIFQNPYEYGYRQSYYHVDYLPSGTYPFSSNTPLATGQYFLGNRPNDMEYNSRLRLNASISSSAYLLYQDTYTLMGNDEFNFTGIHGLLINRSAQLDPMMAQILKNNTQYAWIYLEFEQGVQRTFPWSGTDFDIFRSASNPTAKDYKTEDWYRNAKAAGGKVVFSEPYVDEYIDAVVTCSRAIYNGSTFLGVVAIDMTLETISNTVGNIKMYKNGYGFLIDNQGSVIAHPDIQYGGEVDDISLLTDVESDVEVSRLLAVQANMTQGKTGFIEITKASTKYYLGYAPVKSANFSLGVLVPVTEVLEPVSKLQSQLASQIAIQITILLVLFGIVLAVILIVGVKVAKRVVHPIQRLSEVAIKLSTEDIHKTLASDVNIDTEFGQVEAEAEETEEIGDLMNAFKSLVKKVREEDQQTKK